MKTRMQELFERELDKLEHGIPYLRIKVTEDNKLNLEPRTTSGKK